MQAMEKKTICITTKDNRTIRLQIISSPNDMKHEVIMSKIFKEAFIESKQDSLRNHCFAYKLKAGKSFFSIVCEYVQVFYTVLFLIHTQAFV